MTPDECLARAEEILDEAEAYVTSTADGTATVLTNLNIAYTRATALVTYGEAKREQERRQRNSRALLGTTSTTKEN